MPKVIDDAVFTKTADGNNYTLDVNVVTTPLKDDALSTKVVTG